MNRKEISLMAVSFLCAMLLLVPRYAGAQTITPGQIVKWFDESGVQTDSVINENAGNIGIGTAGNPDIGIPLHISRFLNGARLIAMIENTGPFSAAVLRLKTPATGSQWELTAGETGGGAARAFFIRQGDALSQFFIQANTGNIGIGTEDPAAKVHIIGDVIATGMKSALIETASYGKRRLYAMESPENWFEDFGGAQLVRGQAVVRLEPIFGETVSTKSGYHVFLSPKGDCNGLYVAKQTATSFEVRELRSGKSTVAFDYRVVAKRKGVEHDRLAELRDGKNAKAPGTLLAENPR